MVVLEEERLVLMSDVPKGHHGASGIVPVFLAGEDVYRLHQFAVKNRVETDQLAASLLMKAVLRAWDQGQIEFDIKESK